MTTAIVDFHALLKAVVDKVGKYKVYNTLRHDKNTADRWLDGGQPEDSRDIGGLIRLALVNGIEITKYQTFTPIYDFSPELSYEDNMFAGPPELNWVWDRQDEPPTHRFNVSDFILDCPLGVGAGPLTGNDTYTITMLNLGFIGPTTFKTRRAGFKEGLEKPQIAFVLQPPALLDASSGRPPEVLVTCRRSDIRGIPEIVNSMGVPSEAAAVWQKQYENVKNHPRGKCVGLSVMGEDTREKTIKQDFQEAIARAQEMAPPFIELNVSCPNLKGKDLYRDPEMLREICAAAKQQIKQKSLLFLKLPCVLPLHLPALLKACGDLADAMVFKNTVRVRPVKEYKDGTRIPAFLGREFGGLSGPSTFPLTLRGVREIAKLRQQLGQKFAIVAVGGIQTAEDVAKLLEAGACGVQAVTTPMFDPLLALKVRYRLRELIDSTRQSRDAVEMQVGLLTPRDEAECMALSEASQAANEVRQRNADFSYATFTRKWNVWLQQRSSNLPGQAQRLRASRRKIDWIRDFTS